MNGKNNGCNFNLENISTNVVQSDYMRQLKRQQMYNIPNLANVTMPNCESIGTNTANPNCRFIGQTREIITLAATNSQNVGNSERIKFNSCEVFGGRDIRYLPSGDIAFCGGLCDIYFRIRSSGGSAVGIFLDGSLIENGCFSSGFMASTLIGRAIVYAERGEHLISLVNTSGSTLKLSQTRCSDCPVSLIISLSR